MTAEEEAQDGQTRKVLVGIRFDSQGRELLSWAVVKVADPGDHVVALHVCKKADDVSKEQLLLDSYLESYKGLCDIKKVNLTGRILIGKSIRKGLVKEAKSCGALAVVVGTSKQTALGGWLSTAKHCTKHLPSITEVLSIHNGKVVFKRNYSDHITRGLGGDPKPSFHRRKLQSSTMSVIRAELRDYQVSEYGVNSNQLGWNSKEDLRNATLRESIVDKQNIVPHLRTVSLSAESCLDQRPGWPLLRKTSMPTVSGLEARKMSVVQWVMSLPSRTPPDTPHVSSPDISFSEFESPFSLRRGTSDILDLGRNSQLHRGDIPEELGLTLEVGLSKFTWFSYEVLMSSTSEFSSENLIGKGGCSQVYKGVFPDGRPVAVKVKKSSKEAWKDFSLEIDIISSLKHKNISPLLGVCIENNKLISVYEFMPKGSLEDFLHDNRKEKFLLSWEARFSIAVGIAEALNHLHTGCSKMIIHRDVKSSNILLSDDFQPQLSDFGLAIWGPTTSSSLTCDDVVGTFGYLAPEYFMYGKVSDKIDVYSFGVVLLELLSGKKPIDSSKEQESLIMWAKATLKSGEFKGILDPQLEGHVDENQMQRMILAATLCLTRAARLRPHMNQILKLLKGEETIEKWTASNQETLGDETFEPHDDEVYVDDAGTKSHLTQLALFDVDDDRTSSHSSIEQNSCTSLEEYLRGRWSRSSSINY